MMNNNYKANALELREAVMETLVFFDLFNYPLTHWEIWQNLKFESNLNILEDIINELVVEKNIYQKEGFCFLPGREDLIEIRRARYNYANYKIKLARRASRLFRLLPSVKLVAVSNLIGHHNLRNESDIDIFVVSSPHRLWLTRLYCTGLMKIMNKRPTKQYKQNKICLSFYVSVDGLCMESLRFKPDDPYFDHWFLGLYPIYDEDRYLAYLRFKNPWLKNSFPNSLLLKEKFPDNYWQRTLLEKIFFCVGDWLDFVAKKIQIAIMPLTLKNLAKKESGVVITDSVLRFYLNDRRAEFHQKYYDHLANFKVYEPK
ncbi:MAG: hypothetical protein WCK59_04720 [Candidatus Falkowbacteria bacterium]